MFYSCGRTQLLKFQSFNSVWSDLVMVKPLHNEQCTNPLYLTVIARTWGVSSPQFEALPPNSGSVANLLYVHLLTYWLDLAIVKPGYVYVCDILCWRIACYYVQQLLSTLMWWFIFFTVPLVGMATCTYGELIKWATSPSRVEVWWRRCGAVWVACDPFQGIPLYIHRSTKPVSRHTSKDCSTNQTIYDWKEQVRWRFSSFLHETNMGP